MINIWTYGNINNKENEMKLSAKEMMSAIDHLKNAQDFLEKVRAHLESGVIASHDLSEDLWEAFDQVNFCRSITGDDVNFEGCNQSAMGNIMDAKCMIDSLAAWKLGMTTHAYGNISQCIFLASILINRAYAELSSLLYNGVPGELRDYMAYESLISG